MGESWDWKKALLGIVDPTRYCKDIFLLIRLVVICAMIFGSYLVISKLQKMFSKPVPPPTSVVSGMTGGSIENTGSKTKTCKFGVITF